MPRQKSTLPSSYALDLERLFHHYGMIVHKEYCFAPGRRFRFDYCLPSRKIAWEIEGGIFSKGRHISPMGFMKDCEKYNLATRLGWRVYRLPAPWFSSHLDEIIACLEHDL